MIICRLSYLAAKLSGSSNPVLEPNPYLFEIVPANAPEDYINTATSQPLLLIKLSSSVKKAKFEDNVSRVAIQMDDTSISIGKDLIESFIVLLQVNNNWLI